MTRTNPDKITPEEWRTAAKVARRSIFGNNELADAWDNVAKYFAAADLATQLAKAYIDALHRSGLTHNTWAYLPDAQRTEIRHGMQFVLAHLRSTGRLIPAGGMALTAEQVEDVRTILTRKLLSPGHSEWAPFNSALNRLRALVPATEPAEATGQDFLDALPTARECFSDCAPAAPAEPAEEETKAEGLCMGGGDMHPCVLSAGHAGVHTDSRGLRWNFPASSPVVPAPTETGPWQRIEDVPETVGRLTDRDGDVWEWDGDNWVTPETAILPTAYINKHYAPFVAAGEG